MKIWKKLLIHGLAAALIGVSVSAQGAQNTQDKGTQVQGAQKKVLQEQGPQGKASQQNVAQKTGAQENPQGKSAPGNGPQEKGLQKNAPQQKPTADFRKLDASALPITQKIQIGGDADWLGIGFGSVWVTVAKNNEVVRVDPARN